MPEWWEEKLKIYQKEKEQIDQVRHDMPSNLDWISITRLKNLQHVLRHLQEHGDPYDQIQNVEALIKSYTERELVWDGQVTYLSRGKALGRGKFDWADVEKYNAKCNGEAFCIEGVCFATIQLKSDKSNLLLTAQWPRSYNNEAIQHPPALQVSKRPI